MNYRTIDSSGFFVLFPGQLDYARFAHRTNVSSASEYGLKLAIKCGSTSTVIAMKRVDAAFEAALLPTTSRSTHLVRSASMHLDQQKQEFSKAYVHAVASVAGFKVIRCDVDDDSIDVGLSGNRRDGTTTKAPKLDIQLKCTETDDGSNSNHLACALKIKNYDDLRVVDAHVPSILVVLCVPTSLDDWLIHTPEQTVLRRVAYWVSLRGRPAVANDHTCTVHLPRVQRFTVDAVREIMQRIGNGASP